GSAIALPLTTAEADERQPRTEQVSVAQDGTPADVPVENGRISGDGPSCTSPRVVENDTNEKADVFGTDRPTAARRPAPT
ncbi:hypothetical protein ADL35_20885, partial [Streptomyces sp. NRRL WC-3753]